MLITADELSSKLVTVRYNQEKLLDCVVVRGAEMIVNQLEDTMKCEVRTKNNRSLKKCVGEQRNSYLIQN
jgi:hypothetical protein